MKNKIWNLLKAFAAFAVILVFLFLLLVSVIAQLFPAVIPDWMYTVLAIVCIPLAIVFFVIVLKEWFCQRKEKKAANKNKRPPAQKHSND